MRAIHCCLVLLLLFLIHVPACWAEEDLLATLQPEHPRLLASRSDFASHKNRRSSDARLDEALDKVERFAARHLDAPLLERKKTGIRLLSVSRAALERVTQLALAYHMTGDERFARRAEAEMLNVCEFSDWNPSHFLDVAEMAAAVGLGYDWLYDQLSEDTRRKLRAGLRDKALRHLADDWWWKTCDHNWNSVCHGGLTIAALAIAEDEPQLAQQVLAEVLQNNPLAVAPYGPDGVYPEGPGYWVYGTSYQVLLIESLRSALGTDHGLTTPALLASGQFVAHTTAPSGLTFNFADCSDRVGTPVVLHWFARETDQPGLLQTVEQLSPGSGGHRLVAMLPLWLAREAHAVDALPLSWCGKGEQPVAMFRTSWTDSDAMYLAVKGGRGYINHGQLDAGSFVLEADGVRWALDPGRVDYHAYEERGIRLFDRRPDGDRWKIFPYVNAAHNTLTIGDQRFDVNAHAAVTQYEALEAGQGKVQFDLSKVLTNAQQATRKFEFDAAGRQVTIVDRLTGLVPDDSIRWTLVTRAQATIDGNRVSLNQDGKSLRLESNSDTAGSWKVEPFAPPEGFHGDKLPSVSLLTWNAQAPANGRYDLTVRLQPTSPEAEPQP